MQTFSAESNPDPKPVPQQPSPLTPPAAPTPPPPVPPMPIPIAPETPASTPPMTPMPPTETPPAEPTPPADGAPQTIGFFSVLKEAFTVVKEKLLLFLGISILNVLSAFILMVVLMPLAFVLGMKFGGIGIFGVTFLIPLALGLVSYLLFGAASNQAGAVIRKEDTSFGQSLKLTFGNLWKFIVLCLRIFVYSGLWVFIVVLVIWSLMTALGMLSTIILFILGLVGVLIVPVAMVRLVYTAFAIPTLMSYPNLSAKEALTASLEMTHKRWWLTVCFITVFGFLMGLIPAVISFLAALTGSGAIQLLSIIFSVLFAILTFAISIAFFQVMLHKLADDNIKVKLHVGLVIAAILVFLMPFIMTIAAPFLGIMALQKALDGTTQQSAQNVFLIEEDSNEAMPEFTGEAPDAWVSNPSDSEEEDKSPRLPKLPGGSSEATGGAGVDQKVFDDLFGFTFAHNIWTDYYPMFAQDEKNAIEYTTHLTSSSFIRSGDREKPMFAPFYDILNYLGKQMYDYERIDEKVTDTRAYYLYTAMAANRKDFSDPTRWKDFFCYPFVKEDGEWKMKIARYIPEGSYENMSLDDPTIMGVCQDFIKPQPIMTGDEVKKRLNLDYDANLNFDIYLNGHLIKAFNIASNRPLDSGAMLPFPINEGENTITVKTGVFDSSKIDEAQATITVYGQKEINDLDGIDPDSLALSGGYEIAGRTRSGDTLTGVTLQKEAGQLTLGANEEKTMRFHYDSDSDSISPL